LKSSPASCDIFCRIVDNYGDIGICWRLARQLSKEHGLAIRLWIDDLATAKHLIPQISLQTSNQTIDGINICHWGSEFNSVEHADIVIETFACELPERYLQAMSKNPPLWLNLEYLSAESWVSGFHAQTSKHPTLPLIKTFFFPGFTHQTGGLIRERTLIEERLNFQKSIEAQKAFWQSLNVSFSQNFLQKALKVSLFSYPEAPLKNLLDAFINSSQHILCAVPGNSLTSIIRRHFGEGNSGRINLGNLTLQLLPFLSQDQYDRLLWACDLNFVRGEDSWVRAIWASRPMVWQPYRQAQQVHLVKLAAFLEFYSQGLSPKANHAYEHFHHAWSANQLLPSDWSVLLDSLPELALRTQSFSTILAEQSDLASRLVSFCKNPTYPV
jgi:uncharacterized repeat protein (TIGR03837 family)